MTPDPEAVNQAVRVLDLTGVLANAILGGIAARSAGLDIIGFIVLALLSGLGGGMIRDALLQSGTVAALADPLYLVLAPVGAGIAFVIAFRGRIAQAQKTLDLGLVLTAVGGGTVRDALLRKVPSIFGGNTLYATSAVLASVLTVLFYQVGNTSLGSIVAIGAAAALSLLARRYHRMLPTEARAPKPER